MHDLRETTRRFLLSTGWPVTELANGEGMAVRYVGENGALDCVALIRDEYTLLLFLSDLPLRCPPARRPEMTELVGRANRLIQVGCLEFDPAVGTLRYRTSLDLEGAEPSTELVRNVVFDNVHGADGWLPALQALVHEGCSPTQALRRVVGDAAVS